MNSIYNIVATIMGFLIPIFIVKKELKKEDTIINFIHTNKYYIIVYATFVIGFLVRLVGIADFPNALNVDELSGGYDAYSILNFGIDRNGNFLPVYLEAWGSGQSAMYAYLIIPFINILGLNILTTRLPMAIIGCISLFLIYRILKKTNKNSLIVIGTIFFAITPWHIMKSRWGMDCNIFPDFILYATFFIIKFLEEKKSRDIYIASLIIGLSAYTYATSFFFLPVFVLILMTYLIWKKEISIRQIFFSIGIIIIITFPMILYVIINKFNLEPIRFLFTIPVLTENRFEEVSNVFSSDFFKTSLLNFKKSIMILITQNDNLGWNELPIYGIAYIISSPFMIIGIIKSFKIKNKINHIFNIWFIASLLLLFVVEPNINRINIIIIPLIYYTILGIEYVFEEFGLAKIFLPIIYISLFICFEISYFSTDWNKYFTFNNEVENVIKYVDKVDKEKIYFEYSFKEPYIYICFYNKIDTREYIETVKYKSNKGFDRVESFGKYYFYIPNEKEQNAIYVIKAENEAKYKFDDKKWSKKYIDNFVVIEEE